MKILLLFLISIFAQFTVPFDPGGGSSAPSCGTTGSNSDAFTGSATTPLPTYNACWVGSTATNILLTGSNSVSPATMFTSGSTSYSGDTSNTSQVTVSGGSAFSSGPIIRFIPGSNTGYACFLHSITGGNYTTVDISINGGSTIASGGGTWATASPHTLKIIGSGTALACYVDGVSSVTTTDSTFSTGGPGFFENGDSDLTTNHKVAAWQDS